MNSPKLSVLTTCYNREKYIAECIDSILNSSFEDFELIIVDDNSKDNSWNIIQQYAAQDIRIKPYRNDSNLGDYPNRNKAANLATGEYLKYVDADDVIGQHFLHILVCGMEAFPSAGLGLFAGQHWSETRPYPKHIAPEDAFRLYYTGQNTSLNRSPLMTIIRKSNFDEVGGFSGRQHLGDFELWHKLISQSGVVYMPSQAWVRVHDQQQSQDNRSDPTVNFKYQLFSLDYLQNEGPSLNLEFELIKQKKKLIARTIIYAFKRHGTEGAKAMKAMTGWSWATVLKYCM